VRLNIPPPDIRPKMYINRVIGRVNNNTHLPIYNVIMNVPIKRLKLKHPVWKKTTCENSLEDI